MEIIYFYAILMTLVVIALPAKYYANVKRTYAERAWLAASVTLLRGGDGGTPTYSLLHMARCGGGIGPEWVLDWSKYWPLCSSSLIWPNLLTRPVGATETRAKWEVKVPDSRKYTANQLVAKLMVTGIDGKVYRQEVSFAELHPQVLQFLDTALSKDPALLNDILWIMVPGMLRDLENYVYWTDQGRTFKDGKLQ